jgi:hypothetical protein
VKTSIKKGGVNVTAQNILEEEKKKVEGTACGTACGATDSEPASSACGTSCGAGE